MSVKAKIISIRPYTGYMDVVYDQVVIVEFADGTKIGTFDYDMYVKEEMLGTTQQLLLLAFAPKEFEIMKNETSGIEPSSEDPFHFRHHTFYGQIKKILFENSNRMLLLDVGLGDIKVLFGLVKNLSEIELKEGDYIKVKAGRTDLLGIL